MAAEARAFLLSLGVDLTSEQQTKTKTALEFFSSATGGGDDMTIGPVQLLVLGFDKPEFRGEIIDEFERLRENDTVRVIDALVVYKDAEGDVAVLKGNQLSKDEAEEFGAVVGGLLGLGAGGEEGMEAGAIAGAEAASDGVDVFDEEEAWDVLDELPYDAAAALILLEHRWAIGLRDAIVRAGGFPIAGHFISPPRSDRDRPDLRGRGRGTRRVRPRCVVRCSRRRNGHDASRQGRAAYVSAYVETDGRFAIGVPGGHRHSRGSRAAGRHGADPAARHDEGPGAPYGGGVPGEEEADPGNLNLVPEGL